MDWLTVMPLWLKIFWGLVLVIGLLAFFNDGNRLNRTPTRTTPQQTHLAQPGGHAPAPPHPGGTGGHQQAKGGHAHHVRRGPSGNITTTVWVISILAVLVASFWIPAAAAPLVLVYFVCLLVWTWLRHWRGGEH